jgi:hypothetical protein
MPVDHIDATREQQSLDQHVRNLLGFATLPERRAYLQEMGRHYEPRFVERVKAEFGKQWESKRDKPAA